jgi:LuxR family maltose regulon positive regulatory protein
MDGQLPTAQGLVSSFRAKAEREKATQLMDNLSAFEAWLSLYFGDGSRSEAYLLTAPDEKQQFCTLDRYRVITKIRCLIAKGKLAEALDSALSMDEYFASYGRHYLWMENQILKAIILYRQDDAHWQQVLTEGLKMAEHYHFVRLAALEGSAVQSLLENLKTDEISPEFLKEVRSQAGRMALQYPDYLHYETVETPELTPQEQWICLCYVPGIPKNLGVRVHHDHGK